MERRANRGKVFRSGRPGGVECGQAAEIVRWPLSPMASRLVLTASGLATCAGRSGRSFRYEARG